jgi:hypothetical protein
MIMCMDSALQSVQLRKGAVMSRKLYTLMKSVVVAGVLGLGASGVASADDSSMNPFQGESYRDFNGGNDRSQSANPTFDQAPSEWQRTHPEGVPERVFQSYSAWGTAWKDPPVFAAAPSDPSFQQTHPNGMSEREYQALSSEAPAWRLDNPAAAATVAAEQQAPAAQTRESFGQRLAHFFHASPTSSMQ